MFGISGENMAILYFIGVLAIGGLIAYIFGRRKDGN